MIAWTVPSNTVIYVQQLVIVLNGRPWGHGRRHRVISGAATGELHCNLNNHVPVIGHNLRADSVQIDIAG